MGMMSDHFYTIITDKIISVHVRTAVDTNLLSTSGGGVVYELRIDGELADSHHHGMFPKGGSMFTTIVGNERKTSVRVDVSHSIFGTKYKLLIDDVEAPLKKSSETEIKELWHKKSLR